MYEETGSEKEILLANIRTMPDPQTLLTTLLYDFSRSISSFLSRSLIQMPWIDFSL